MSDPEATKQSPAGNVGDTQHLNDAQQSVIRELGAAHATRPTFPDGLAAGLRHLLTDELGETVERLGDESVFLSKFMLSQVLSCEARHIHEYNQPFAWSIPTARGTVAHKAVELSISWRTIPLAGELVDEAIGSLANDGSAVSEFLRNMDDAERAQLRSECVNATQAFLDGWPPLRSRPQWRPAVEVRGRVELFGGRIQLGGKVDLTLGGPDGDRSGRVIVDLKTGRRARTHVDDLRFYALIETLRFGTPPRALASYYLDESRLSVEPVTSDVLFSAARRVVDGTKRHVRLLNDPRTASRLASYGCTWCPLLDSCETGMGFLAAESDDDAAVR